MAFLLFANLDIFFTDVEDHFLVEIILPVSLLSWSRSNMSIHPQIDSMSQFYPSPIDILLFYASRLYFCTVCQLKLTFKPSLACLPLQCPF
jgi:hypothetical protein